MVKFVHNNFFKKTSFFSNFFSKLKKQIFFSLFNTQKSFKLPLLSLQEPQGNQRSPLVHWDGTSGQGKASLGPLLFSWIA
jgi:hypothetical protein